jgi:3-oxoadipate enol-lactonase
VKVDLAHREDGAPDGPPVVLASSLGTTLHMWDELTVALAGRFRVIRFDTRGHGDSPVPPGPYSMSELTADVVALADSLGLGTFSFVGLSLGGAIGQTLAIEQPGRLSALVLCCTGPSLIDPATWRERAARVRAEGMGILAEPTRARWFTPEFVESHPDEVDRLIGMITSTPPEGYAGCCDALEKYDVSARLGEITVPTRVIAGSDDLVTPPSLAEILARDIPDADLVVLDDVSHIACVARPEEFNAAVLEHLEKHR